MSSKATRNESRLLESLLQKDEEALTKLVALYQRPILNFIRRQIKDTYLAEEIAQDVFIEFFESLRNFRQDSSLKTFLFSIAKYKVIDTIRKKKIKKILFSALPPYVVEGLKTILLDDEIDRKELQSKIQSVFEKLPNDYQLILRLKYMDNRPVREIAAILRLSFKATESLLYRARKAFVVVFNTL